MNYPLILMCVCILYALIGVFAHRNTRADEQGKWNFVSLFQAAVIWLLVEVGQWLAS